MTNKQVFNPNSIRTVALAIVVIGAIGSLCFMFNAGRNQKSILLIVCFTSWVLSPFVGLLLVSKITDRWTSPARASFYLFMIVMTIGSLVAYNGTFNTPHTKPAFIFLVVPFISWLLITLVTLIVLKLSRKTN